MKPSVPKGTRDFLPSQVAKRKYIFEIIESVFNKCGYVPIETPTMENLSTLTGKYGEEGDRLLFKILNNGDFLSKADESALANKDSKKILSSISKRGLRYDLTVPFARYVVMHQNDLYFPFKRYQIQPVWRADRPQKGRYNEFYQCDADVVGSKSLVYEAELVQIFNEVFGKLKVNGTVKLNNRKILSGMAELIDEQDNFMGITIAIDKLDKIGEEGVGNELAKLSLTQEKIDKVLKILATKNLPDLKSIMASSEIGMEGISEIEQVQAFLKDKKNNQFEFDITLARGLNYYTGCIIEVAPPAEVKIGSIGGGGRYDDLTAVFGLKDVSGVGISFGAARIFDVMEELNLFPPSITEEIKVLITYMDAEHQGNAFDILNTFREAEISSDMYPTAAKFAKQMKYADKRQVPYVIIIGSDEIESGNYTLKSLATGEQERLPIEEMVEKLKR